MTERRRTNAVILSGAKACPEGRQRRRDLLLLFLAFGCVAWNSPLASQPVSLHLRPRVGDTLRMVMDQDVEMWGTRKIAGIDSTRSTKTSLRVLTRAVVLKSEYAGTLLNAVAESLSIQSNDADGGQALEDARRRLIGRAVQLRMAVDGATQLVSSQVTDPAVTALFAQMPATLPNTPVSVGAKWTREMIVPAAGEQGMLRSTFRLDSLTKGGQFAWISISGTLLPPTGSSADEFGGTMSGALVVDRKRGWLVEAKTLMNMQSIVPRQAGQSGEPMAFRMRVRQWVRAVER